MKSAGLFSLAFLAALLVVGVIVTPYAPNDADPGRAAQPPNRIHWLGTDHLGRDVLSRVAYGGIQTCWIALVATAVAGFSGTCLGVTAGVWPGWPDRCISLVINTLLAFPPLLGALIIVTLLGQGRWQIAVATGAAQAAFFARLTRSAARAAAAMEFVESAHALGAGRRHIMFMHILPTIQPTLWGAAGLTFSYSIINSAGLAFLGLGGSPDFPDWGLMLAEGRAHFRAAPWISLAPGVALSMTVWALNRLITDRIASESL